ncbi:Rv0361 family membrane protein [Phytohabitans suffuscus]|uniref:Rv0361 family membrane protein n=1 Tax=Phytohabitans suffuscus TaxID=624315 RepID=UPI001E470428|nr:hypothetical protein [Phytohabitans suffuscus]
MSGQPISGQPAYPPPGQPAYAPPPPEQVGYPGQVPGQPYPAPVSGGPYAQPTSGQPFPGQPTSGQPFAPTSGHPQAAPGYPVTDPAFAQPGYPGYPGVPGPERKKSRTPLILSLVGVIVVLLCGGGVTAAVLLMRNTEPNDGAAEPVAAVQDFLKAVYNDQDVTKANDLVCAESRDETALTTKVDEIKANSTKYKNPRYKWDEPKVDSQEPESATVSVKVTMTTQDEKVAEQQLKFTVVQKTGWFVCEIGG